MRFKINKEHQIGFGLVLRQLPGDVSALWHGLSLSLSLSLSLCVFSVG